MATTGIDLIPLALSWYDRGILPLPLHWMSKRPAVFWKEWATSRPTRDQLISTFDTRFYRNLALMVGPISNNLVVLDFDSTPAYARWRSHSSLHTYTVATSRGYHVYVRLTTIPPHTLGMEGGDVKATGYVVAPPSRHPSGAYYRPFGPWRDIVEVADIFAINLPALLSFMGRKDIEPPEIYTSTRASGRTLVAQIKSSLSIPDLLCQYTELFPSGPGYEMAYCPFHNDRTPSMWVSVDSNLCQCFKHACVGYNGGRPMDVINLYAALTNQPNERAILSLARKLELL